MSKKVVWTCFASNAYDIEEAHLTHKYLGKLSPSEITNVELLFDNFFENNKIERFSCLFDQEAFFGPNNDIRVLTPSNQTEKSRLIAALDALAPIRLELDKIKKDDFEGFNPHVTTPMSSIFLNFSRYCIVVGNNATIEYKFI
jgi:2'-5' RNA ligase